MPEVKPKTAAIVQARMGSLRLPGKVLMQVEGKPVVWWVLERLRKAKRIDEIVLAIPDTKENDVLEHFAKENNIKYYRGSEGDVLKRYYQAAKQNNVDVVVRITADCPLIDPEVVDTVMAKHLSSSVDYTSNVVVRSFPKGLDVEVFNFSALKKAHNEAKSNFQREHVTPYFLENPEIFNLQNVAALKDLQNPGLRITVDTKEDLDFVRKIAKHFSPRNDFSALEIVNYVRY